MMTTMTTTTTMNDYILQFMK